MIVHSAQLHVELDLVRAFMARPEIHTCRGGLCWLTMGLRDWGGAVIATWRDGINVLPTSSVRRESMHLYNPDVPMPKVTGLLILK